MLGSEQKMDRIENLDIKTAIIDSVIEVFDMMISMQLELVDPAPETDFSGLRMVGSVNFAGAVTGMFNIHMSREFAHLMTASMLEMETEDIKGEEEIKDVVGEITNMVGGSLKAVFSNAGIPTVISTPSITTGSDFKIESLKMDRYERFVFQHRNHPVVAETGIKMQPDYVADRTSEIEDRLSKIDVEKIDRLDIKSHISNSITDVFDMMLSLEIEAVDKIPRSSLAGIRAVSMVSFAGDVTGIVSYQVSRRFSRIITAEMLGMKEEEFEGEEEINDVLSEMSNIVGGKIKSVFTDIGLSCDLSTPSITSGSDFIIESLNMDSYERFSFQHKQHVFFVEVGIKADERLGVSFPKGKKIHYDVIDGPDSSDKPSAIVETFQAVESRKTADQKTDDAADEKSIKTEQRVSSETTTSDLGTVDAQEPPIQPVAESDVRHENQIAPCVSDELRLKLEKLEADAEQYKANEKALVSWGRGLHEPVTSLLKTIQLLDMAKGDAGKSEFLLKQLRETGYKLVEIEKMFQKLSKRVESFAGSSVDMNPDKETVLLLVEPSDPDFETINAFFKGRSRIRLSRATTGETALRMLKKDPCDLILISDQLPDESVLYLLRRMDMERIDVPRIVIAGQSTELTASQIIQAGAFDYLPRERINHQSFFRIIINALEKADIQKERNEIQTQPVDESFKDTITGLYNCRYFVEIFDQEVSIAKSRGTGLVLCLLDLDDFKAINESYGRDAGDMILSENGGMISKILRQGDLVYRYADNTFAIIMPHSHIEGAKVVCERILQMTASHRFEYSSHIIRLTMSAGISAYNGSIGQSPSAFLAVTEGALQQAKQEGGNRVKVSRFMPMELFRSR